MPIPTADARPAREARPSRKNPRPMILRLGVVLLPLFVAACGLPPAVTIASLAIDALSLAVSEKTLADHAISQIAQKDCAMWRGFTSDSLCIDEDGTFAVAAADGQPTAGGAEPADSLDAETSSSGDLVDFTTASAAAEETAPPIVEPATAVAAVDTSGMPATVDDARPDALGDRPASRQEWVSAAIAGPGLYYVIGTFSRWTNAERLTARHSALEPSIVTAKLDGRRVFRVVIGPFGRGKQKDVRSLLRRAGIYDAWGIRMDPADWFVARSAGTARNHIHSVAELRESSGS